MLNGIMELPDYMDARVLEKYFYDFLKHIKTSRELSLQEASEALYELADRQWHTYELISSNVRYEIENWIEEVWNLNSKGFIDNITSVIGYLGLGRSFKLIKQSLELDIKDKEIKQILLDTVKELDGNVEDPYSGM